MSRTLVALATYNEIENLPSLIDAILQVLPGADVLVIDDNSPDGTGRWCDDKALSEPRVSCIHRPGKQGLGTATISGMRYALERDYELFATLDADWSHDPDHLPELLSATQHADVAIGSRYCPGGAIEGWPVFRRVLSYGMNSLSRVLLRLPVQDMSGAFRAYRVAKLRDIDLAKVQATGYAYPEEILWLLHHAGATVVEVPITFRDRRAGRSKISAREALAKFATTCRLAWSAHSK